VVALENINLEILPCTTFALVGESGSGKSTLARCLARLENPDSGTIFFNGRDITRLSRKELIPVRRRIQLIFQHSAIAMNPLFSAEEVIGEPLRIQGALSKKERHERVLAAMERVGLSAGWVKRRPAEFSGGQRQRLAIARALILKPDLLIFDEALAGIDLTTQVRILEMLMDMQVSLSLAYLFITHDLRTATHLADTIAVMQDGRIVELRNRCKSSHSEECKSTHSNQVASSEPV
jgi:ABC-type glutathione transport system ATPase component